MVARIDSFRDVIALWPSKVEMASDVAVRPATIAKWWQRDRIPAEYWSSILGTAVASGSGLSCELLASIAARELSEART